MPKIDYGHSHCFLKKASNIGTAQTNAFRSFEDSATSFEIEERGRQLIYSIILLFFVFQQMGQGLICN
ncbi:hypothetical protein phytr_8850 [Candidatus Phycorickettsia trachydisci]|uniref:Uncharacterized protein n=1 Tax=Candidatus Phycorickettsia trachydisci TaxID=2115978 RepID=A0A2P1P975_9RICK|nr:hypothetical protein phytr_8850 [Candidatus Phycorickettsia trachydisci]